MTSTKTKIAAIPKGFRSVTASIALSDIQAGLDFYTKVMDAKVLEILTVPDSEMLLYAQIKIAGTTVLLTYEESIVPTVGIGHITLHHYLDALEETWDAAIDAGAIVISPITATWWGDLNGVFVDPFGIRWSLAKRVERLKGTDKKQRLNDLYLQFDEKTVTPMGSNTNPASEFIEYDMGIDNTEEIPALPLALAGVR